MTVPACLPPGRLPSDAWHPCDTILHQLSFDATIKHQSLFPVPEEWPRLYPIRAEASPDSAPCSRHVRSTLTGPRPPGVVSTAAELDRELIELYEFSVDVSDEGVPPRRSAAVVKVTQLARCLTVAQGPGPGRALQGQDQESGQGTSRAGPRSAGSPLGRPASQHRRQEIRVHTAPRLSGVLLVQH